MALTDEQRKAIAEQRKTHDVDILGQNLFIDDFPTEPRMLYLKTNNFIQQGLNRLLGYVDSTGKWKSLRCDVYGRLIVGESWTKHDVLYYTLLSAFDVPGSGTVFTTAVEIEGYPTQTILISSSGAATTRPQISDDGVNWYELYAAAGTVITYATNNNKKAFIIEHLSRYFRVAVTDTSTAANTVTVVLNATA